jgi:hypothetical protein
MKEKTKLISDVIKMLLLSFLNGIDKFLIKRIPVEDVRIGLTMLLSPIRSMINALNDDEPKNDEQVRELWRKFSNTDLADYSETTLHKLIATIKNEHIRPALSTIVVPTVNMLRIVTDEDPDNEAQLETLWMSFLRNPETHDVVLDHLLEPMLSSVIKNPDLVEYILQTIADILEGQGDEEKAATVRTLVAAVQAKNAAA